MSFIVLSHFGTWSLDLFKNVFIFPVFITGTVFVIIGVYLEHDQFKKETQHFGWQLLLLGLAAELFAAIGQSSIDEEISHRQSMAMASLEETSNGQKDTIQEQQKTIIAAIE